MELKVLWLNGKEDLSQLKPVVGFTASRWKMLSEGQGAQAPHLCIQRDSF